MRNNRRIIKKCLNCGRDFTIPRCRNKREHCCSAVCKKEYSIKKQEQEKMTRIRACEVCGKIFFPRKEQIEHGRGLYCSKKCNGIGIKGSNNPFYGKIHTNESKKQAVETKKRNGNIKYGKDHHAWKGGLEHAVRRYIESGKAKKQLRTYRRANPHKRREWEQNRKDRKTGKLPRGTVSKLYSLQKGMCAICNCKLDDTYHVDHMKPLALGGEHEPYNVQLLCPTCNVRKGHKDPIIYMQKIGKLI